MGDRSPSRILLLTTKLGYQTRAFVEAAQKLGLDVVFASDRCERLDDPWRDHALPLKFHQPDESARKLVAYARANQVEAIVAIGDRPTSTAARACAELGLPSHPVEAADLCRDKHLSRRRLRAAGLLMPKFETFPVEQPDVATLFAPQNLALSYPVVLKPLALSGSRGVIRADSPAEAARAFERIRALLKDPDIRQLRDATLRYIQVEEYIAGIEVALEAVMDRGRLHPLALFDKPEPLEGPFFEETIYVTPSRLAPAQHRARAGAVRRGARPRARTGARGIPLERAWRVAARDRRAPHRRPVRAGAALQAAARRRRDVAGGSDHPARDGDGHETSDAREASLGRHDDPDPERRMVRRYRRHRRGARGRGRRLPRDHRAAGAEAGSAAGGWELLGIYFRPRRVAGVCRARAAGSAQQATLPYRHCAASS
jgi:hypothetical protein